MRRPVYNEQGDLLALKYEVSEPKTEESYRTVQLAAPVIEALQTWRSYLQSEPYGCRHTRQNNFIFFNHTTRKPYTYAGFRCIYYRFLERNGLRKYQLNLHSYRHTYATLLIEAGTSPKMFSCSWDTPASILRWAPILIKHRHYARKYALR